MRRDRGSPRTLRVGLGVGGLEAASYDRASLKGRPQLWRQLRKTANLLRMDDWQELTRRLVDAEVDWRHELAPWLAEDEESVALALPIDDLNRLWHRRVDAERAWLEEAARLRTEHEHD